MAKTKATPDVVFNLIYGDIKQGTIQRVQSWTIIQYFFFLETQGKTLPSRMDVSSSSITDAIQQGTAQSQAAL